MILINMDMPESCKNCRFHERFNGNFYCAASTEEPETSKRTGMTQYEFEHQRWKECPLAEANSVQIHSNGQTVYHIEHVDTLNL